MISCKRIKIDYYGGNNVVMSYNGNADAESNKIVSHINVSKKIESLMILIHCLSKLWMFIDL